MLEYDKIKELRDQIQKAKDLCQSDTGSLSWESGEILVKMGLLKKADEDILQDPAYEQEALAFALKVVDKILDTDLTLRFFKSNR